MNAEPLIEVLKRLTYRATTPIFLVLDGYPVHRSKRVTDYVASTDGRLRLLILQPYSPHLNPDEWVWNWLKRHKLGKARVVGPDQFRTVVERYLRSLQKLPTVIRGHGSVLGARSTQRRSGGAHAECQQAVRDT